MVFRAPVSCSTLADANERREWRIWADMAALLIRRASKLYCSESSAIVLDSTVYALDATTIGLCRAQFPWAPPSSIKAAIMLHTLLDLRGNIPAFIYVSDGMAYEVNVLNMRHLRADCHC